MKCPNCDKDYASELYIKYHKEHPDYPVIHTWRHDLGMHMHQIHGWVTDDIERYIEYKLAEEANNEDI